MRVIKRNGEYEPVSFDKVLRRIQSICGDLPGVDAHNIAQKVCSRIYDGVTTAQLDELAAQLGSTLITEHPDYGVLGTRIIVSNHHKNTSPSFSETIGILWNATDTHGKQNPLISEELYRVVMTNKEKLNNVIDYQRDYLLDYFGFKTLERSYLMKVSKRIVERPQHMWMRVSLGIHGDDVKAALETYDLMSRKYFTHATPTLFNAGTPRSQLASCFLVGVDDSITGIYKSLSDCAQISKYAGGIGIHIHAVRARDSHIRGTNGSSTGIIPMLRVYNATSRYVNQGGKRLGSIAVYLEPWHADIEAFIDLRKNHGNEEERCRDLFTAMWIPDLFMKRVLEEKEWSLMCPDECPGLSDVYGEEFEKLYTKYEAEGRQRKKLPAQQLWIAILKSQIETGTPYLLYKDAVNLKSNQQHSGVIKSSNLCVAPETKILTKEGYKEIETLEGMDVSVWNGEEWSATRVMKTGENQQLVKICFSDGSSIECTPYHKFYVQDGYISNYEKDVITHLRVKETEAKNLVPGMRLIRWDLPTICSSKKELKYAYTHGVMCGDGTLCSSVPEKPCKFSAIDGSDFCGRHQYMKYLGDLKSDTENKCKATSYASHYKVSLYDEKKKLLPFMNYRHAFENKSSNTIDVILYGDIEKKFLVPHEYSLNSKLEWLAGLMDTDGSIARNGEWGSIQIGSVEEKFLMEIKQMLETMGVHSKVTKMCDESKRMLPDHRRGYKEYKCQPCYRLHIAGAGINHLLNLGLETHRLDFSNYKREQSNKLRNIQVTSIEWTGRISNTFCVNEPKRHAVVFNGILTGNCTEIMEISNSKETAVCNLASIALPTYVKKDENGKPYYDFEMLHNVTQVITRNLNNVIDRTFYPTPETEYSNKKHRPIGIGVQGLADAYILMGMPFDSPEAAQLNREIFETIYHGAVSSSMKSAKEREELLAELEHSEMTSKRKTAIRKKLHLTDAEKKLEKWRGAYETFAGSPASLGKFQFDMWADTHKIEIKHSGRWDWEELRNNVMKYGMRNSLLLAPMPTASTSQILGFNEAIEPFTSNFYQRRVLSGEFSVINKYLIYDLIKLGIWNSNLKEAILSNGGSIQNISGIPEHIKNLYKIVWEMKQKVLIDQSADRGVYVCQSQSLNLFVEDTDMDKLSAMHFYGWRRGLKTGIYYLRTRPKIKTAAFTLSVEKRAGVGKEAVTEEMVTACRRDNPEACELCSS